MVPDLSGRWERERRDALATYQTVMTTEENAVTITLQAGAKGVLTYALVPAPQHGTLSGTAPNLIYTPVDNFTGNDQLTFQVSDGQVLFGGLYLLKA